MQPGEIVGGRFEIEQQAGSGGMGQVFRARDRETGGTVALKLLHSAGPQQLSRFTREAQALAALRLPGIVSYIDHGATGTGHLYIAMEWLTGETLAERLVKGPLSVTETLMLAGRVANTLGAVHRHGLVHRDIKPSNLMLVAGTLDDVMLIDFGIVRISGVEQQLTLPGSILGTPGYMAPEQARGQLGIDARSDVFALGCVIYKCLVGRAPFQGADGFALMAKVLIEEPPRLRELNADVPERLDALVARMLAKSPDARPRDGVAVAAELAGQSAAGVDLHAFDAGRTLEITTEERKVMCLVLARRGPLSADGARSNGRLDEGGEMQMRELEALAASHEGRLELIEAQSPMVTLSSAIAPTELAVRAARCALDLQALLGRVPVAIVTGRAELSDRLPVGDLVDRATQLLPSPHEQGHPADVRIDQVTAALLGGGFEMERDAKGWRLRRGSEEFETIQQLLGKPTACVGRDRELALLTMELDRCLEESSTSAVIVTGTAGLGKSRLRQEFLRLVQERDDKIEIWLGQGDPMSSGSAFGLLAHALRRAMGILDGEPIEVRQRKVLARVARHRTLEAECRRVAMFLGELIGTPFSEQDDAQLRAARRSPVIMSDQIRLAWQDFIRAECEARPLLLVLEDLHWGDLPTVTLVDAALRHAKDLPFVVLAFGRPEVHELFPKLWHERKGQEINLTPLGHRASERLVRHALGDDVNDELVKRLVTRADGNAFFLEEQIRAVVSGNSEQLPETVLAMVQARLEMLDPGSRRVLRAASIFGETFWQNGVAALVGSVDVSAWLAELTEREMIVRRPHARFQDEVEYRFRHTLVRESAYAMLTEGDRTLGHALAGDWLERAGETDPMVLAEHFERGGERARAAGAYRHAAEEALRGNDLEAAIARAARGIACGAEYATAGALRLIEAEARLWRGEFALAEERGVAAIGQLAPGTAPWFSAVTRVVTAAARLGGLDRVERWMATLSELTIVENARIARSICVAMAAVMLSYGGRHAQADALIDGIEQEMGGDPAGHDLELVAHFHQARAFRAGRSSDPGVRIASFEKALAAFEQTGDHRNACATRQNLGFCYGELGDHAGAEATLRAALAAADRMELRDTMAFVSQNLGLVLAHRGQLAEAREIEEAAISMFRRHGDTRSENVSRIYLSQILLMSRDLVPAESEARTVAELLQDAPALRGYTEAIRARALLGLGRIDEARAAATEAYSLLHAEVAEEGESLVRLVYAEALHASGALDEAAGAMASAQEHLLTRAARISDPVWRERFLHDIADNARTLTLARQWLGKGPA